MTPTNVTTPVISTATIEPPSIRRLTPHRAISSTAVACTDTPPPSGPTVSIALALSNLLRLSRTSPEKVDIMSAGKLLQSDPAVHSALRTEFEEPPFSLPPGMPLKQINPAATMAVDIQIDQDGLMATLRTYTKKLTIKGLPPDHLEAVYKPLVDSATLERLLTVYTEGIGTFMVPEWEPNGGREFKQSPSFISNRAICIHKIQDWIDEGVALTCSKSLLTEADLALLNFCPFLLVPKASDCTGRLCWNLKWSSVSFASYNSAVDVPSSKAKFPDPPLCNASQIAEMCCRVRDANPGEQLSGATVDSHAAYTQAVNSAEKACLVASLISPDEIVIMLANIWGDQQAGNYYGGFGTALGLRHNALGFHSLTYTDDGNIVDTTTRIQESVECYAQGLIDVFGPHGENKKKRMVLPQQLVGLGFDFNLDTTVWRVSPKDRNIRKIAYAVQVLIPPGSDWVDRNTLQSVAGLLCWHSQVIRPGASYLYCMFNTAQEGVAHSIHRDKVRLSPGTKIELDFWRAVTVLLIASSHFIGVSIDTLRTHPKFERYWATDASSVIGFGGWISLTEDSPRLANISSQWTKLELQAFAKLKISINTLEFFAAIYCLLVWSCTLEGTSASIRDKALRGRCDNKAAISYLSKMRARSPAASNLSCLFSLMATVFGWHTVADYITSADNFIADNHSRNTSGPKPSGRGRPARGLSHIEALINRGSLQRVVAGLCTGAKLNAFADNSWSTYRSAFRSWQRFCSSFEYDCKCVGWTLAQTIQAVDQYVSFECGVRQMAPTSIKEVYMSGIKAFLTISGFDQHEYFDTACKSALVGLTMKGFDRYHAKTHPAGGKVKLPFTLSASRRCAAFVADGAIIDGHEHMPEHSRYMARMRQHLAMDFGIYFMLRKSEFIFKPTKDAPAVRQQLSFFDNKGTSIPYNEIGLTAASQLYFNVNFSKTDQLGNGRVSSHIRQEGNVCCIVQRMEHFIRISRDKYEAAQDSPIFEVPSLPRLTSEHLAKLMKATATLLGLPADKVSAHSLRYGGATMLAAAGFPEYVIANYGGWAEGSQSLRRYTRPTTAMITKVSEHMSGSASFAVGDELMMHIIASEATRPPPTVK